jgi:hypothetical protein
VALDLTQYLAKLEVAGAFAWVAPQLQEYAADSAVETYLDGVDVGAELAWVAAGQKGAPRRSAETESVIDGGIDSALGKTRAALSVLPRLSDNLVRDLATEARAVWDGFSHFCRTELGLPPETVLRAHFAPLLDRLERQREALDTAQPRPDDARRRKHLPLAVGESVQKVLCRQPHSVLGVYLIELVPADLAGG